MLTKQCWITSKGTSFVSAFSSVQDRQRKHYSKEKKFQAGVAEDRKSHLEARRTEEWNNKGVINRNCPLTESGFEFTQLRIWSGDILLWSGDRAVVPSQLCTLPLQHPLLSSGCKWNTYSRSVSGNGYYLLLHKHSRGRIFGTHTHTHTH